MQAEGMQRAVRYRPDVHRKLLRLQQIAHRIAGAGVRQRKKEIHLMRFEGIDALRAHALDHLGIPIIGALGPQPLQTEIDPHHCRDARGHERNQNPVHGKTGLRFARNALIPSAPSALAAWAAMVSDSCTICDSSAPSDWAKSRLTLPK